MKQKKPATAADTAYSIRRITLIGMGINILLSGIKFLVGILGSSQAVIADAVHSLSDLSTDVAVLLGVRYWSAPADEDHPYGHARIETIVTVFIGGMLLFVAGGIAIKALGTIREMHASPPEWIAVVGPAVSIVLKEVLYWWTVAVGKEIKSSAIIANAWHHRSDAFSSVPPLLAVIVAVHNPSWAFVDHIGALIVSLFIGKVAWDIMKPSIQELTDRGGTEKEREDIGTIARSIQGVRSVHAVRTRKMGALLYVDLHVLVDGALTVKKGHDIAEMVKRKLIDRGPRVYDVVVHVEPYEEQAKK